MGKGKLDLGIKCKEILEHLRELNPYKIVKKTDVFIDVSTLQELDSCNKELDTIKSNIATLKKEEPKISGILHNDFQYRARLTNVDPRIYLGVNNLVPKKRSSTNDKTAYECLNWVWKNIKYITDRKNKNLNEWWNFCYETLKEKVGDCEDGSILLANMMINSGIPEERVFIAIGNSVVGYHAWVMYYSDNKEWLVLDWCLYPTESLIGLKWTEAKNYAYIDFMFNTKNIYINNVLSR